MKKMMYKKIDNFIGENCRGGDVAETCVLFATVILSPIWFPIWLVSKFWNTINQ